MSDDESALTIVRLIMPLIAWFVQRLQPSDKLLDGTFTDWLVER